jgi:protein ImuB
LRLLQDKIATLDMGFGVDLMALAALVVEPLSPAQVSLTESAEQAGAERLTDCLVNRLGADAVRRLHPGASHIPELAQHARSAFAGAPSWSEPMSPKPPRPALLFAAPELLTVIAEVPEGPPGRFTWRHVTRRVVKAEGPERVAPEWWRLLGKGQDAPGSALATNSPLPPCGGARAACGAEGGGWLTRSEPPTPLPTLPHKGGEGASGKATPRTRDYYRIEDEDGRRYWVFREGLYRESELGSPCWYLHGVFG